eukprot:2352600-Lingulodinium_polyedra.AAC.1
MHIALQQSDVSFWEPPRRVGVKKNRTWLGTAANACNTHRRSLKTILGVKDADICQVNVFGSHCLGTVKKNTLIASAQELPTLPGMSIVFYP